MKVKECGYTISKGYQDVLYEEHLIVGSAKVRIRVKSDNCKTQGRAYAEAFDPKHNLWNIIASLHGEGMETETRLYAKRDKAWNKAAHFSADRCTLLDKVLWVLE